MQPLTAPPRDAYTDAQVRSLLTADALEVSAGCELLDSSGAVVADLSDDLVSGEVERNNYADVHGACKLTLTRELAWGRDRVRPYMVLSSAGVSARFNLGVFVLTTPEDAFGESPRSFAVDGFDLLYLLQAPVGDTYAVASGTTYLQAVRDVLAASGVGGALRLDGTLQATTLPSDMVWCLTESDQVSWLRIINDLLAAIGYRGLWVDQDGTFRSEPYLAPAQRPVEWAFDVSDPRTNIVGEDRRQTRDVWGAPNRWRFVRKGMTTQPSVGAGIYDVTNQSTGASSVDAVGRLVAAPVQYLDAADQASLQAQGDRVVDQALGFTRVIDVNLGPFPILGHFDVATIADPDLGGTVKVQGRSWSLPLDGGDVKVSWEVVGG